MNTIFDVAKSKKYFHICHRGALGDFILTWPAILSLRKKLPSLHFHGIGKPDYMSLAVKLGILDSWINAESSELASFFSGEEWPSILERHEGGIFWMKDANFANFILFKTTLPIAVINPFPDENDKIHVAEYHLREIRRLFSMSETKAALYYIPVFKFKKSKRALIHPGSGSLKKNWAPEFYLEAANLLKKSGHSNVKFILGHVEIERGYNKYFNNCDVVAPKSAIELADLIGKSSLFLGNDSGPAHLAAFLGTRTVVFHKSTDPSIWGALGHSTIKIAVLPLCPVFRNNVVLFQEEA